MSKFPRLNFKGAFGILFGFVVFIGCTVKGPEMVSCISYWINIVTFGHCPSWLEEKNADTIGRLVAGSVILISFIVFLRPLLSKKKSETKFNPDNIADAEWVAVDDDGKLYRVKHTKWGGRLSDKVKSLFNSSPPVKLGNDSLEVRDPKFGPHKRLRFKLSDGRCFYIDEYGLLTIDSARECDPYDTRDAADPTDPETTADKLQKRRISRDNPGRSFEVLCQQLGNRTRGQTFTDYEFRKANPALPPNAVNDPLAADDYYEDMLQGNLNSTPPRIRII
jgi:hypothetical protein